MSFQLEIRRVHQISDKVDTTLSKHTYSQTVVSKMYSCEIFYTKNLYPLKNKNGKLQLRSTIPVPVPRGLFNIAYKRILKNVLTINNFFVLSNNV